MKMRLPEFNPVALKELRQLVRTKVITWGLVLHPALLLVAGLCAISAQVKDKSPTELAFGAGSGSAPFCVYMVILVIVAMFAIPLVTAIRTVLDTSHERMSLEFITALTPADIIGGKMTAAFLLMLVAAAVTTPFFALAYLLRGVPLALILLTPALICLGGLLHLAVLMPIACRRVSAISRICSLVVVALVLSTFLGGPVTIAYEAICNNGVVVATDQNPRLWLSIYLLALVTVCPIALSRATAAEMLASPGTDSQHSLRLTEFIVFAVSAPVLLAPELANPWQCFWLVFAAIAAFRAFFRAPGVPRAVAQKAPATFVRRLVRYPFVTGRGPSLAAAWIVASVAAIVALAASAAGHDVSIGPAGVFLTVTGLAGAVGGMAGCCHAGAKTRTRLATVTCVWIVIASTFLNLFAEIEVLSEATALSVPGNLWLLFSGDADEIIAHLVTAPLACAPMLLAPIVSAVAIIDDFRKFRRQ